MRRFNFLKICICEDDDRYVFAFELKEETIGFAMVNNWTIHSAFNADQAIAEFYIKRQWRNKGFGKIPSIL